MEQIIVFLIAHMEPVKKKTIEDIVEKHLKNISSSFIKDYKPNGAKFKNITNKANNIFISSLGADVLVYSALMRSLDSSLGNQIEKMALEIASKSGYNVSKGVEGELSDEAVSFIAKILEQYKNTSNDHKANLADYEKLRNIVWSTKGKNKFHNSDYLLEKDEADGTKTLSLLELKIGGDLDNKKSRSEKEAIFEQYAILVSKYQKEIQNGSVIVRTFFATAYNKNSENSGKENWSQASVKAFFADEELLIGKDFWNLICNDQDGWTVVKEAFSIHSHHLKGSLSQIVDSLK